jgi:protoporphyrinogen oxidase
MLVHEVRAEPDRVSVRAGRNDCFAFDHAVLTVPCSRAAAICPELGPAERRRLEAVVYQGVVCASLLLRRPLSAFYITNITDAWVPFTGVIEYTALLDRAALGGHSLVYLPRYLPQGDPFWDRTDDDVRDEFLPALARMHPDFRPADLVTFRVARAREVQAIPTLRYSAELLPPTRTSLPGVFLANSAQIVNGTLNVNETVALATAKAAELAPLLRASPAGVGV